MSDFLIIIIFVLIAVGAGLAIFFIKKISKDNVANQGSALGLLKQDLEAIKTEIKNQNKENQAHIEKQLRESQQIVGQFMERLTRLDETNKQVIGFAQQLQSLENILKNPKQRGNLGEYALELLLERAFSPKQYAKQYQFKNNEIVDFVLFVGDKILAIDSKFSLENYNKIVQEKDPTRREQLEKIFKQDLKTRIDETAKYIRPQEGTFNFALMFIPAEGIYYDLLINEVGVVNTRDLIEYAAQKKVSIVSPNSFYAMLQTILEGLKAFQIEKSWVEVRKNVETLSRHLEMFGEYMTKLGGHLSTAVNTYNTAFKELGKVDKDVMRITDGERVIEPLQIDKPNILE